MPAEALYYRTRSDAADQPLTGARTYRLHFPAGALPPVSSAGFWSLTMYDPDMFLVPNAPGRYALGDRSGLTFNPDGSLDLYLSARPPTGLTAPSEPSAGGPAPAGEPAPTPSPNWLPAPDGPFTLMLRAYLPTRAALANTWHPPAVTLVP